MTLQGYRTSVFRLPHHITILTSQSFPDGQGGYREELIEGVTVRGRIMSLIFLRTLRVEVLAETDTNRERYRAYIPPDIHVDRSMHLRCQGKYYHVTSVQDAGGLSHHTTVDLTATQEGEH